MCKEKKKRKTKKEKKKKNCGAAGPAMCVDRRGRELSVVAVPPTARRFGIAANRWFLNFMRRETTASSLLETQVGRDPATERGYREALRIRGAVPAM